MAQVYTACIAITMAFASIAAGQLAPANDALATREFTTSKQIGRGSEPIVNAAQPLAIQTEATASSKLAKSTPNYSESDTLPIDLETVLRLTWSNTPALQFATARVREANARLEIANIQWIPNLSVGTSYNRFDGQTQNQRGDVFGVSRSNLLNGVGASMTVDTSDALYAPLIERRINNAEILRFQATKTFVGYEAISAYLDLLSSHALLKINEETIERATAMYVAAKNAKEARLDRSSGDVNRAQAELLLRKSERFDLQAKSRVNSGKLVRILLLPPSTVLVPADPTIATIELIDPNARLDDLISEAIAKRADLAAQRQMVGASVDKVEKRATDYLYPKLAVVNQSSVFGGGINNNLENFDGRNTIAAQVFWEVKHFGLGNRSELEIRKAELDQHRARLAELTAQISSEITEAAAIAIAKYEALALAEKSVAEATELYRITREGTLNVVDNKNLFDALRPLQAIQLLNQSQVAFLQAVTEFNRAQFRLHAATGNNLQDAVSFDP